VGLSGSVATFAKPHADALTSLALEFVPHMPLALDESVWVGLPGFELSAGGQDGLGGGGGALEVELTGPASGWFRATWQNASEERPYESVRLRVTSSVAALAPVSVTLAASAGAALGMGGGGSKGGLRVPAVGLRRCDAAAGPGDGFSLAKKCLSLSTDAAAGPVPVPVPVLEAPAIGSYGRSSTVQW